MRFHVVGVGSIGTLLSFHLKRTGTQLVKDPKSVRQLPHQSSIPYLPSPYDLGVVLRLKKRSFDKAQRKVKDSVYIERDNAKEKEIGFGVEMQGSIDELGGLITEASSLRASSHASTSKVPLPGSSRLEELGHPKGSIDSLIVTTKAQHTLSAIRSLLPYITSATTIVLLQNGQGVLDILLKRLFPDPATRPHFILASTTHGAWLKGPLHCVHAGYGKIDFGVVPNQALGREYERLMKPEKIEDDELREAQGTIETADKPPLESSFHRLLTRPNRPGNDVSSVHSLPTLDIGAIPNTAGTQTLLNTISMLLNLPLAVTWQPIRKFQLLSLKKLVVNACINPVTALVECRNGDLFGNKFATSTMRDICKEISQILHAVAENAYIREEESRRLQSTGQTSSESQSSLPPPPLDWENMNQSDYLLAQSNSVDDATSPGVPALDPSLRPGSLYEEVQRVIRLTGPNYSSMYQDIKANASSTEIQFINGYFSRLGKSLGIPTPINDLMVNLIQLKTSRTSGPWVK
jgi:2-dehydropantoate 2-reductase